MLIDALADILGDGIAEGAVRYDTPAEILAIFLLGMLRTRARDINSTPEKTDELLVNLFLNGVSLPAAK